MSGCRIGKISFKSGGSIHVLKTEPRSDLHYSVDRMAEACADKDAIFAFFGVMHKDRTVAAGWPYKAGITNADILGAVGEVKRRLIEGEC
jgi:hypothetical protein